MGWGRRLATRDGHWFGVDGAVARIDYTLYCECVGVRSDGAGSEKDQEREDLFRAIHGNRVCDCLYIFRIFLLRSEWFLYVI